MVRRDMSFTNRLTHELSPYLLQHASNPVDWHAWGNEAFDKARREDKPIFLSIGYSTCHWCHVMANESFEDEDVASLLNKWFVSIKVDREERPDIDNIYMTVCQAMIGQGGWPLTIIMTPDRKPFFAATYIPKFGRYGRPGLMELLPRIAEIWRDQRSEVLDSAEAVTQAISNSMARPQAETALSFDVIQKAFDQLAARFDRRNGGFGGAPKFPSPHNLVFLLRYAYRTKNRAAVEMVRNTLVQMRVGGIYDHLGFGFHRYSTDAEWKVPHFEKMLYDQALLLMAYTEAWQVTGQDVFRRTVSEIIEYLSRDLRSPEGGFYSAEDADSEGEEGKFYLWTRDEIIQILGEEQGSQVAEYFQVRPGGNFDDEATGQHSGRNILHTKPGFDASPGAYDPKLDEARVKLLEARKRRIRPSLDDKILTDWNGLTIAALAIASRVFQVSAYYDAADSAASFLLSRLADVNGRLLHRYRNGQAGIQASLDDYSFLVWGCLELYETRYQSSWLETARNLTLEQIERFWDEKDGGFFFTPSDGEQLIVKQKELYDGAVPSGNSVAFFNLLRLGRLTGDPEFEARAARLAAYASSQVSLAPLAYTAFLTALDFALGPTREIVISGSAEEAQKMLKLVQATYLPDSVVVGYEPGDATLETVAPFVKSQPPVDGRAAAYVCRNHACERPVTDVLELSALLST